MAEYSTCNEPELMKRFVSGDDHAFREIYQRYDKPLYLYAYHKLGNKEDSRDVVQDVFAWMLNNRAEIDLKVTLSGYLYRSVLNRIYNIFKHRKVLEKYTELSVEGNPVEEEQTDYRIREKEIRAMIESTIAEMPPKMREVYELKSKQYMTAKEIAAYTGTSEGTVNTQLKRAMKHLRLRLGLVFFIAMLLP